MLNHNTIRSIVMLINRSDNQINDKEITKRRDREHQGIQHHNVKTKADKTVPCCTARITLSNKNAISKSNDDWYYRS